MQEQQYFYANVVLVTKIIFCFDIFAIINNKYDNKYFVFERYLDCYNNRQVVCVKFCDYRYFSQIYYCNKNIKNIRLFRLSNTKIDFFDIQMYFVVKQKKILIDATLEFK